MRFLLDVNVLVSLAFPRHEFHERAHEWFRAEPNRLWATCPLTQGGFVRVASRLLGGARGTIRQALAGLEQDCQSPHHQYWPVSEDLSDLSDLQRTRLIGPNQIADLQLLLLAHRHRGQLVTFDTGIRELALGMRYEKSLLML